MIYPVSMFVSMDSWEDIADYAPCVKKLKHKRTIESFGSEGGRTFLFQFKWFDFCAYTKKESINKEETDYLKELDKRFSSNLKACCSWLS